MLTETQIWETIDRQIEIVKSQLADFGAKGLKLFATSSFQTHSIPMIHLISRLDCDIPVYFLDTGFHFPETIQFKSEIAKLLGVKIVDVQSPTTKIHQRSTDGQFFFMTDPAHCCYLNKTLPMEPIIAKHDVWISGVRKSQNANRQSFEMVEQGKHDSIRFHPMLNWDNRMIWLYRQKHSLPEHPLESEGYLSVGCLPCTAKLDLRAPENSRAGRWAGLNKTECGLHTDLIDKK